VDMYRGSDAVIPWSGCYTRTLTLQQAKTLRSL